jgi:hypothetical protein
MGNVAVMSIKSNDSDDPSLALEKQLAKLLTFERFLKSNLTNSGSGCVDPVAGVQVVCTPGKRLFPMKVA